MSLRSDELEQLADDIYKNRRLTTSTYCDNCGYNLRTLPYVYTCPECGQSYNARPLQMKGVFAPYDVEIPWNDMIGGTIFAIGTFWSGIPGVLNRDGTQLALAGVFLLFSTVFFWRSYGGLRRLLRARRVSKRIAMEERGT